MTVTMANQIIRAEKKQKNKDFFTVLALISPSSILFALLLVVPLILVVVLSFSVHGMDLSQPFEFSFEFYIKYFTSEYQIDLLIATLRIGLITTLFSLALSYPYAYLVSRVSNRVKVWLTLIIAFPFLISGVIRTIAWMVLLGNDGFATNVAIFLGFETSAVGLLYTETGVIIGLIYIMVPYMVLILLSSFEKIPVRLEEAASSLGANAFQRLRLVLFPLSLPGILAGTLVVFTVSVSSYIVPSMLGGTRSKVVAMELYNQGLNLHQWQFTSAIAMVMVLVVLFISFLYTILVSRISRSFSL